MRQDLIGFESLFGRFLQETGPSVLWDKVVPLPSDHVSNVFPVVIRCKIRIKKFG